MTPEQVKRLSVWEFDAAVAGWVEANSTKAGGRLTAEDENDLWQGVMERMH